MNDLTFSSSSILSLLRSFLEGRNSNTLNAYRADLLDFATFVNERNEAAGIAKLLTLDHGSANMLIYNYRNALKGKGLRSSSINRKLSSVRAVVKLARMAGLVPWNIEVPNEKSQSYRDTRGVGTSGVEKVLDLLYVRANARSLRDIAIIRLFYDLGLRISETVGLDLSDLDLLNRTVKVLGKGRTEKQSMSLPVPTVEAIEQWLTVREAHESDALFLNFDRSKKGKGRITRSGLYKVIKSLGAEVNLKIRPHGFRHDAINAGIKAAQANGIEMPSVLQFSRHKNLTTLQIYIDTLTDRQGEIASLVASTLTRRK